MNNDIGNGIAWAGFWIGFAWVLTHGNLEVIKTFF